MIKILREILRKNKLSRELKALDALQKIFFSCYLQRDYAENYFEYEKLIHEESDRFLHPDNRFLMLYEIILCLGALRYRTKEYSLLEPLQTEFSAITGAITSCLKQLRLAIKKNKAISIDLTQLLSGIQALENLYQHVLQVLAKDPIVFLFFIYDLYALHDQLEKLNATTI